MMVAEKEEKTYFEYMRLAKHAFARMVKQYPELEHLSSRELEIFEHLMSDKTLAEIATELYVSHSAVHFHCKNIYKKLGISSRRQLLITYKELYQ